MRKGAAALLTVFLVSVISATIAAALVLVTYFLLQSATSSRFSGEALIVAHSGLQDAILKFSRNPGLIGNYTFTTSAGYTADIFVCSYTVFDGSGCSGANAGKYEIVSTGRVRNSMRRVKAVMAENSFSKALTVESITELPI